MYVLLILFLRSLVFKHNNAYKFISKPKFMIAVGGLYLGREGHRYLGVYHTQHDTYVLPHPDLRDSERLGHFTYLRGGRNEGVDVFLLNDSCPDPSDNIMDVKKVFWLDGKGVKVDKKGSKDVERISADQIRRAGDEYGIQGEVIGSFPQSMLEEVLQFERADIAYFCGDRKAKIARGYNINFVPLIIPVTSLKEINPESFITSGKQLTLPECCLEGNRDFGKGCTVAWTPGENARFDGKIFTNWFWDPWGECNYCYAERKHKCPPKTVYRWNEDRFREELLGGCRLNLGRNERLGRPVDILRYGKLTEVWTPWSRNNFMRELEIIADLREQGLVKTRCVVPTKLLPFSRELADLFKRTESVVLYSIGWDEFELGAANRGCTNDWRLEQAIRFREAGVNSVIYLLSIAHKGIGERESRVLEIAKRYNIPVQILPVRFMNKRTVRSMTGQEWDLLKGKGNKLTRAMDQEDAGSYTWLDKQLVPVRIHKDWLDLVGKNKKMKRMCHHDGETLYCGGCFQRNGFICPRSCQAT